MIKLLGPSSIIKPTDQALVALYTKHHNPKAPTWAMAHYFSISPVFNINLDWVIPQMWLETGFISSARSQPPFCNMAGIGATNDGAQGSKNVSYFAGVQEHIGHLWAYAGAGEGNKTRDLIARGWDKSKLSTGELRFDYVRRMIKDHWGPIVYGTDLNTHWAWPGKTYGQDVEGFLHGYQSWLLLHRAGKA